MWLMDANPGTHKRNSIKRYWYLKLIDINKRCLVDYVGDVFDNDEFKNSNLLKTYPIWLNRLTQAIIILTRIFAAYGHWF